MELNNTLWQLVAQSDSITKIVLILLFFMSVFCWTITIFKSLNIKSKIKDLKKADIFFNNVFSLKDLINKSSLLSGSFVGDVIAHYLMDLKFALKTYSDKSKNLNQDDWHNLKASMYQTLENILSKEESFLTSVSTIYQIAPLMGLFGTVWGLIHSFVSISYSQTASITAVAPGIAEALITTLSGLVVAIPAVIMHSFLQNRLRFLEEQLINLTDKSYRSMRVILSKEFEESNNVEAGSTKVSQQELNLEREYSDV